MKNTPIQKAIDALNEAFANDPEAIKNLFRVSSRCNAALAAHPTVQVSDDGGVHIIRFIGLLNGAIEPATGERIAMIVNEAGELTGFCKYDDSHE